METTLHQQLKRLFAGRQGQQEVKLGDYRIDAVRQNILIEIQQSSLGAIQDKIIELCHKHDVDVVKPLIIRKQIVQLDEPQGRQVRTSWSPKRGNLLSLFGELIHFTRAFPHPRLRLLVPEVDVTEARYPGHGRRRRHRKSDFVVQELTLHRLGPCHVFRKADDLLKILDCQLPGTFDTKVMAETVGCKREEAQQIAFCLRETGAIRAVGKRANAVVYELGQMKPEKNSAGPQTIISNR